MTRPYKKKLLNQRAARIALCLPGLVMAMCLWGCCLDSAQQAQPAAENSSLKLATTQTARGVIIITHGLNQRPSSLDPLSAFLQSLGFHTYRLTLTGHDQYVEGLFPSSTWEHDLENAFSVVAARFPKLPIHLIGYSLGGLITTRVTDFSNSVTPRKIALLAPALSLRTLAQGAYALTLFPSTTLSVQNIAPPDYKRFNQTPLFWYENTIELYTSTRRIDLTSKLHSIPTLIVANPRDELVSFTGLKDWLEDNQLAQEWRLEPIHPQPKTPYLPGHLIVDERSLGVAEWRHLKALLAEFFSSDS